MLQNHSSSFSKILCLAPPPPPPTLWGGAHAGVSYKKLFVMNNSKHIQSKQKCIMNLQVLTGQLPQLSVFTHSHNIYTSTHSQSDGEAYPCIFIRDEQCKLREGKGLTSGYPVRRQQSWGHLLTDTY